MKTFNQNAAILLFERIESLRYQPHESWRSIYLKLSDKQKRYNRGSQTNLIAEAITDLLAGIDGTIYLCDDGDIFMLFQGAIQPVSAKLSGYFGELDPTQLRGQTQDSLFFIFDLSRHWESFYNLCEVRYLEALATAEEMRGQFTHYPHPVNLSQRV